MGVGSSTGEREACVLTGYFQGYHTGGDVSFPTRLKWGKLNTSLMECMNIHSDELQVASTN